MFSQKPTGKRLATNLVALLALIAVQPSFGAGIEIPQANDLNEAGLISRQQDVPVIVFVSRDACPYCRTLRDTILAPMHSANKFENRAVLLELSLDRVEPLTGFENEQITATVFGKHYRAEITPTLLFLDSKGQEVGKRIVGISNLEFYGHYLQKSTDEALLAIRSEGLGN